jgi:hypothetical protein
MIGKEVVKFEELKAFWKSTRCPSILIRGELANNLLASGLVDDAETDLAGRVVAPTDVHLGPMQEVHDILREIAIFGQFRVEKGDSGKAIRIFPKPSNRREGN